MIWCRENQPKFNDSVIAILESNLHDGPAFFNCYPNFSMNIKNEKTSNAIKLWQMLPAHNHFEPAPNIFF